MARRLKRRPRKARRGEITCTCRAYSFPHRMTGGRCTGQGWVEAFFDPWQRECRRCSFNEGSACQVAQGQERAWECPAFQDLAAEHEMKTPSLQRRVQAIRVRRVVM